MVKYLWYSGQIFEYPMDDDKTGFIVQSDKLENFNDAIVVANASYFEAAPIWGHDELHITRLATIYEANAANSRVFQYICTGNDPIKFIAIPAAFCTATVAGQTSVICSGEIDIPIHPSGAPDSPSRLQFILISIAGVNAADDLTIVFQGWHRGWRQSAPAEEREPQPVVLDGIRSLFAKK
jgi:hypothetical protein